LSGGLTPLPGCHLNLFPMVSWPERDGGEVLRSLVNCFEFELGAPVETDNSLLGSGSRSGHLGGDGRFGLCVGGATRTKVIRSSRLWKKLLEKFRVVLGQVFSRLGRKPKLFLSLGWELGVRLSFLGLVWGPIWAMFQCLALVLQVLKRVVGRRLMQQS
jgi:hypothetical protein